MGYSSAIAVVVAVLAAITLLPALLGALDYRINSLRVKLGRTHPDDHQPHGWARWARGVAARPWRSMLVGIVILGVLAAPVLNLELGSSDSGELPESTTARQAFDLIDEGFGPGANGPLLVSVRLGSPPRRTRSSSTKSTSRSNSSSSSRGSRSSSSPSSSSHRGCRSSRPKRRRSSRSSSSRPPSSRSLTSRRSRLPHRDRPSPDEPREGDREYEGRRLRLSRDR